MEEITEAAELWLRLLDDDFWCEIANHAIHSEHVKYPSATEARRAMLRLAYLKGRDDATAQPDNFDAAVARVEAANAAAIK